MKNLLFPRRRAAALALGLGLLFLCGAAPDLPGPKLPPVARPPQSAIPPPYAGTWPALVRLGHQKGVLVGGRFLAEGDTAVFGWLLRPEILTLNGVEIRRYRKEVPPPKTARETWTRNFLQALRADREGTPEERALRTVGRTNTAWADSLRNGRPGSIAPSPVDTAYVPRVEGKMLRIKFTDQTYSEYLDLGDPRPSGSEREAAGYVEIFRRLMGPGDAGPLVWLRGNFDYRYLPGETAAEIIDLLRAASRAPLGKGDRRRALALKIDARDLEAMDSVRVALGGRR